MSYPGQPGDGSGQQPPLGPGNPYGQGGWPPNMPPPNVPPAPGSPPPMYPPAGQPGYPPPYPYGGLPQYSADPSAPYGRDPMTGLPLSDKSKLTAGLLQIFLGWLGIGRFYLGSNNIAIAQVCIGAAGLVLTALCGIGFLLLTGVGIWGLVDGIQILNGSVPDQYGRKLRD
ncbi:TM2 domain-containing membrane protein YozV [Mycobacterium sp. MAA66]|uniref:TM2 domain-containing protein n=1 Tax=Mycobacterium sp. MAA66 TaxID=3156297 RepID=UPI00351130A6